MSKKYWENETPETVVFGTNFMRCFEKAGKLQFGIILDGKYIVKYVLDRKVLLDDFQAADYLRATIEEWQELHNQDGE